MNMLYRLKIGMKYLYFGWTVIITVAESMYSPRVAPGGMAIRLLSSVFTPRHDRWNVYPDRLDTFHSVKLINFGLGIMVGGLFGEVFKLSPLISRYPQNRLYLQNKRNLG